MYTKEKKRLSIIVDGLHKIAESHELTDQEIELQNQSKDQIARLLCEEELKWYQRSKVRCKGV